MATNNNQGSNIMTSRAAGAKLDDLHKRLALRMAEMESDDQLALLHKIRAELLQEENIDTWMAVEIASIRTSLSAVQVAADLKPLCEKLTALTSRYFKARSSVSTVHELTNGFIEALLVSALSIASALPAREDHSPGDTHCTILVSDALGRGEATQLGHNTIILINGNSPPENADYFQRLAMRVMAILAGCDIPVHRSYKKGGNWFWSGSQSEWYELLDEVFGEPELVIGTRNVTSLHGMSREELFPRLLETVADLRPVSGNSDLAHTVAAGSRQRLAVALASSSFRPYARNVVTMPVALGIFGRFRTARTGKHRGEFSLEELATTPLIAAVRVLAIANGITATATADRIKALLAGSHLGVALADRLLVALHDFIRCQIELEISRQTDGADYFFNPDTLDDSARERFKYGLEDLTILQRLAYQQTVEVD